MSDAVVETAPVAASIAAPKKAKKAAAGPKKPKAKPNHPPIAQMVSDAIKALKERNGSSLPAIKKYIAANNKVDVLKLAPFIKKSVKSSVVAGKLIQTKGKGASGSFKLPAKEKEAKKPKKVIKKKATGEKKVKAKKPSVAKKAKAAPAKAAKKSGTVKPKQKSTKPKAAAKKQKTPKPKVTAKKAAPKKK